MRENADQNNSEYGHFLRSESLWENLKTSEKLKLIETLFQNFPEYCEYCARSFLKIFRIVNSNPMDVSCKKLYSTI